MKKRTKELNAENLKDTLWQTLQDVKAKRIHPSIANAVGSQSRELMRVVRAELDFAKLTGKKPTALLTNKN